MPPLLGTLRAHELGTPGTGNSQAGFCSHQAVMAKACEGLVELVGFGPGQILGCVSSLLVKRPLFVSLPLFAASHARSPSLRCSSAPSPAGTSLSTSIGAGAAGNSPVARGPRRHGGWALWGC